MPFPVAGGGANYTGNFIPEIWSSKLIANFYDATVMAAISNTDYSGEITGFGDKVNIRTTPELTIRDYQKGMQLQVERPDKPKLTLNIDQGDYFAAVEDDVDRIQSDVNLMDAWTRDASERMKIKIDAKCLTGVLPSISALNTGATAGRISGNINLGATGSPVQLTKTNVIDYIVDAGAVLDEANAPESDRFLVIPAWVAAMIKKSDVKDASLTGDSAPRCATAAGHHRPLHGLRQPQPEPRHRLGQPVLQHPGRPQDGSDVCHADDQHGIHPCRKHVRLHHPRLAGLRLRGRQARSPDQAVRPITDCP